MFDEISRKRPFCQIFQKLFIPYLELLLVDFV